MYEFLIANLRNCAGTNSLSRYKRELMIQAADAIEELQQMVEHYKGCSDDWYREACDYKTMLSRWIPVTERCPEKSGDYLVFDDCGNLYVNEWHCLLKKWQYDDSRITHWMPLPEPPKEETHGD